MSHKQYGKRAGGVGAEYTNATRQNHPGGGGGKVGPVKTSVGTCSTCSHYLYMCSCLSSGHKPIRFMDGTYCH